MSDLLEKTWETLLKKLPLGDLLTAKKIYTNLVETIYYAVDAEKQRHILILINSDEDGLTDTRIRGLSVQTRELDIAESKSEPRRYIDITCRDPDGHAAFDLLAEEIASSLRNNSYSSSVVITQVLEKWHRFWSRINKQRLSRAEQIGLFAELWFLCEWLIPKVGAEATRFWRGPFGDRNDFESEDYFVEVKATTSRRARIYHINGIDQLESPRESVLYFLGVRLIVMKNHGESISGIVASLREKLSAHPNALDHLEEGLIQVGYGDLYAEEYRKMQFEVREVCLYEVRDNFPRLEESRIEVPIGVERIEYHINLDAFDDLIVAKSPSEWNP